MVLWDQWADDLPGTQYQEVFGQYYSEYGTRIGGNFRVNQATANEQSWPAATALANGGFFVAYQSEYRDGDDEGIAGRIYSGLTREQASRGGPALPTAGPDQIIGTARSESLTGLGGNDLIRGGGGNDQIGGAPGNDRLFGDAGADRLAGNGGPIPWQAVQARMSLSSCPPPTAPSARPGATGSSISIPARTGWDWPRWMPMPGARATRASPSSVRRPSRAGRGNCITNSAATAPMSAAIWTATAGPTSPSSSAAG